MSRTVSPIQIHDFKVTNRLNDLRVEYLHLVEAAKKAKTADLREAGFKAAAKKFEAVHEEGFKVYTPEGVRKSLEKLNDADAFSKAVPVGAGLRQRRSR